MPSRSGRALLPWLSLLTIWIVWSSTYLGMAAAVETIPPFIMTGGRFLLAAPILIAFALPAWRRGDLRLTWREVRSCAILGVVLMLGGTGLVAFAETELDSSLAALIVSMSPIWMALFTSLQTRRGPDPRMLGALVVGIIGIGVMVGGPGGSVPLIPALTVFVSTLFWSGGTVMARFLPLPRHPFLGSGLQMLFGGSALFLVAGVRGEFGDFAITNVSDRSWVGFFWLIVAGSLIAYSAYMHANATLPIEIVSTYAYVNPVLAVILGATLDNDAVGPNVVVGGTIIVLAVVFIVSGHIVRPRRTDGADDLIAEDPVATADAVHTGASAEAGRPGPASAAGSVRTD
jgi:drug/metabolite transporter (DMT)-like permease